MKLALSVQDGVSVLSGSGDITSHDVAVLSAGLTKLLRSGHNRIVLDLPEAKTLPSELLVELAKLDRLAGELSGRITLACRTELSQSPAVHSYETKELALQSYKKPVAPASAIAPPQAPAVAVAADPKSELRQRELGEVGELRKRAEHLEQENQVLLKQLHAAWLKGPKEKSPNVQDAEVEALRQKIQELLGEVKALQGSPPAKKT